MKAKIKYKAVGECPRCHRQLVRSAECTVAVCSCGNPDPVTVLLSHAVLLPASIYKKWAKIAQLAGVPLDKLVNAVLDEAARQKLASLRNEELKTLPEMIVTVKDKRKKKSRSS
jgi:hypothetical protein